MYINQKSRNGSIKLYNPKKEGLGAYDIHYINAYRKNKIIKNQAVKKTNERKAA
tara:strand:+ start:51 stop:212 length:162 start_codon:yes stop_codon:yes gene_type:complete